MITPAQKNTAISQLRHRVPTEIVARNLGIPEMLVREWEENLSPNDLVAIEANVFAVEKLLNGEVMDVPPEKLQKALEDAAVEIAKEAGAPARTGDAIHAKAVQLCADAITKLYSTIILRNGSGQPQGDAGGKQFSDNSLSVFETRLRD